MKTKEFNLSEKRSPIIANKKGKSFVYGYSYPVKDVKEFIKKLKEDKLIKVGCGEVMRNIVIGSKRKIPDDICGKNGFLCFDCSQKLKLHNRIDKLAGKYLEENKK